MARVNVKALREEMGHSQSSLAELMGVHERTVKRWESAESDPSPLATEKIREIHAKHRATAMNRTPTQEITDAIPQPLRGLLPSLR